MWWHAEKWKAQGAEVPIAPLGPLIQGVLPCKQLKRRHVNDLFFSLSLALSRSRSRSFSPLLCPFCACGSGRERWGGKVREEREKKREKKKFDSQRRTYIITRYLENELWPARCGQQPSALYIFFSSPNFLILQFRRQYRGIEVFIYPVYPFLSRRRVIQYNYCLVDSFS